MSARLAIVTAILFATPTLGHADPKAARPHVEAGDLDYKLGKFDTALAAYSKAYELYRAPALLFNIAQCHRNLKHYERAVFFYEGYLRESPAARNRALVEDLIRESRAELAKQAAEAEAARKAAEETEQRAAIEAARARAEADARVAETLASRPPPAASVTAPASPLYKKWWVWSALGAAAALGGTLYYLSGDTTTVLPSGSLGDLDRR